MYIGTGSESEEFLAYSLQNFISLRLTDLHSFEDILMQLSASNGWKTIRRLKCLRSGPGVICHYMTGIQYPCNGKKVQVYSLILNFTPWSLGLLVRVPGQLQGEHTVLQPFRRIELTIHIVISLLPGTHVYLSQVKHVRVKCLSQGHSIETMSRYCTKLRPCNAEWESSLACLDSVFLKLAVKYRGIRHCVYCSTKAKGSICLPLK